METLHFWVNFLAGLFMLGICVPTSFAYLSADSLQHGLFQRPEHPQSSTHAEQEQVNTVSVTCHPDSLEIVIKADMFAIGAPVNSNELRLGVAHNDFCKATASSEDEYKIVAALVDCGTKHWMTEDALIYTNLLIYSPETAPNGVIRMEEAVIPIECHYERKYRLSSSSLIPTWIPFLSTQAAVETLEFNLRLMTNDWLYERSTNVFYLGEPINIEASVRVDHHMGLRVFVSSCVATLFPDIHSDPKYVFIKNGCLVDSQLSDSTAQFLPRTQDDKLQLIMDAFRFHNDDRGELYITCHLNAVPVNDAESPTKACTFINGRWRSADGNDYLCSHCQSQNEVRYSKPSSPSKFVPRGYGKVTEPEPVQKSGLKTNLVWEEDATVGPVVVLPSLKSGPIPVEELPPVLSKISRPSLYGSQWRSGINALDLFTGPLPTPELDEEDKDGDTDETDDGDAENDDAAPLEKADPEVKVKSALPALDTNTTAAPTEVSVTSPKVEETTLPNATATESALSDPIDPKK